MEIRNYDDTPQSLTRQLPLQESLIRRTSVTVVRRISSPYQGEVPAKQAERVPEVKRYLLPVKSSFAVPHLANRRVSSRLSASELQTSST